MERWTNKVAIVTGASSGIGASIVEELVKAGLKVVGVARRKEKMDELANSLAGQPGTFYSFKADLRREDDILEAFRWTLDNVGPVNILINNAGLGLPITLTDGKTEDFRKIFDVNVVSLCITTKEAIRIMNENSIDGHIININSVVGHIVPPIPNYNVYPASKFAVTALTETLRHELTAMKSKIKVSSISPGLVDTPIFDANGFRNEDAPLLKISPKLKSRDVADSVIYVLSTPPHVQITELTIKPVGELI